MIINNILELCMPSESPPNAFEFDLKYSIALHGLCITKKVGKFKQPSGLKFSTDGPKTENGTGPDFRF